MPNDPLRIAFHAAAVEPQTPLTIHPEPAPLTYTAAELARELRKSVKTIRRLDAACKIPRALKIGHSKVWLRATVESWLQAGAPCRKEWEAFYAAPPQGKRR